jgi:hypothetical protein
MKYVAVALAAGFLTACAMPNTEVNVGGARPTLSIIGAPSSSMLVIDGRTVGNAAQYDGKSETLKLEEGYHEIVIEDQGKVIHSEKVYVSTGENKKIEMGAP